MQKLFWSIIGAFWLVWSCTSSKNSESQQVQAAPPAEAPSTPFIPYPIDSARIERLPSGLGLYVHERGNGNLPKPGQRVVVHYHGILTDGRKFDSSYDRGVPFDFMLGQGQVIRGWDEGIAKLPVGTKAVLIVPPELGYGDRDMGAIPPNSTLIFYVELLAAM
ncbi:MAG: FKBP-type peptidyl-prolyl cis-trans isomerase [Bacteroidia bacterium]|nr:FKBP-type peptidyl-prolyl cis-trans isomerase [Bacteroidia bacterium]MDW8235797.1 FKBP-type peptidyl-prolyl cis-trans isomerase [Bacteroidia bacterium]